MARFINARTLLLTALTFSLLAAATPVALCVFELAHLRAGITRLNDASMQAQRMRDVVDKIAQAMVGFTAIALDVSDEERSIILAETDRQFGEFGKAVERVNRSAAAFVSDEQQTKLAEAVAGLEHSWEEIRDQSPSAISHAEKTFHFLQILEHTKVARDVLVAIEAQTTRAAEHETRSAFDRLTNAGTLLFWTILMAAAISISASLGVYHFAAATRRGNAELEKRDRQLNEQNERIDTALHSMRQGLVMFDSDNRVILCNQRYLDMYRLAPEAAKPGRSLREVLHARKAAGTYGGDPDRHVIDLSDLTNTRTVELPDGRAISITNAPTRGGGCVSTHDDITERRQAEKERDRNRVFLDTIIENVPATLVVKDARDRRYLLVNRHGEQFFGMSRDQMIGRSADEFFPPEDADTIRARDDEVLHSGRPLFIEVHPVHLQQKGMRLVTTKRVPICGDDGEPQYLLSFIEDETERKRAEERLAYLAHHDGLTDLPNRAAFTECLAAILHDAAKVRGSFAVLSIDIDRFKEVNDVFGPAVGDGLLKELGQRLHTASERTFLARIGGDEFAVIASDGSHSSTAEALAERLLGTVAEDIEINGHRLRASLSIGIAVYPEDGIEAGPLLANADAALYRAKAEGRGTIRFFSAEMDKQLRERRSLQHDLRSAIERHELALHYQPEALINGEVIGFEALLRWHHPGRGMISPGVFIPIAEESELIIPMGEWILREVCREAASWKRPLRVAVNLSPVQFCHGDLPALVHSVLLETGLAPDRLELEITENVLIGDFSRALALLRRLKSLGVRIAMDDFGTGYSSLSYLQAFPIDKIKIDRVFISDLDRNPHSAAIVRAVIGLGRALDLPVLAEGVETKEQLALLAREACSEVQGYLIGRPAPIETYAEITGETPLPEQMCEGS